MTAPDPGGGGREGRGLFDVHGSDVNTHEVYSRFEERAILPSDYQKRLNWKYDRKPEGVLRGIWGWFVELYFEEYSDFRGFKVKLSFGRFIKEVLTPSDEGGFPARFWWFWVFEGVTDFVAFSGFGVRPEGGDKEHGFPLFGVWEDIGWGELELLKCGVEGIHGFDFEEHFSFAFLLLVHKSVSEEIIHCFNGYCPPRVLTKTAPPFVGFGGVFTVGLVPRIGPHHPAFAEAFGAGDGGLGKEESAFAGEGQFHWTGYPGSGTKGPLTRALAAALALISMKFWNIAAPFILAAMDSR